jgi:hypothetical protein
MGIGTGRIIRDELTPPRIETMINEHAQLWFYQAWAEALEAADWATLRERHAQPAGTM